MNHIRFDAHDMTLILGCAIGHPPHCIYWGQRLGKAVSINDVTRLTARSGGPGTADVAIAASLALEPGLGLLGPPGFLAHREGRDWGSRFVVQSVTQCDNGVAIACIDTNTQISLEYDIIINPDTGTITLSSTLTNDGDAVLDLVEMATACLPVAQHISEITGFCGRWAGEFHREHLSRFNGAYLRENRRGRTSHDSFPAIILSTPSTNELHGEAYGFHLAWSGNHRIRVDTLSDGRVFASLGALFWPGEIRLASGESYQSPAIVAGYSPRGLSALSQGFHRHIRDHILRPQTRARVRPVHYNSWEAVYFNHDIDTLKQLATRAAAIGVERFVLDDGWFGGRRNDQAGLGDWHVSDAVYRDGLTPLIDHITGLGMEMGLWFEPEMVNPDSDLYRAHPDWVLGIEGVEQLPFRQQYVLDIARPIVSEYLFNAIDAILRNHDIGYIKWDMNRDLNHPGGSGGYARAHTHVRALYALIDRIRTAHPRVEIESCSSGGGRADLGILARTDRIWTSDTNDAVDRQAIQRGASFFLPLDVIGAHVGPRICHITGRTLSMAMRAATALFGHMGLELNLLNETEDKLATLAEAIILYKRHRSLLHSGDFYRSDAPDYVNIVGVVAGDRSEALYSVAMIKGHSTTTPCPIHFSGLNPDHNYRLKLAWPQGWASKSTPGALDLAGEGTVFSGNALMTVGLQLPLIDPETVLIFHIGSQFGA